MDGDIILINQRQVITIEKKKQKFWKVTNLHIHSVFTFHSPCLNKRNPIFPHVLFGWFDVFPLKVEMQGQLQL